MYLAASRVYFVYNCYKFGIFKKGVCGGGCSFGQKRITPTQATTGGGPPVALCVVVICVLLAAIIDDVKLLGTGEYLSESLLSEKYESSVGMEVEGAA